VSFEVPDQTTTYVVVVRDGGVLCGRCDSRVTSVWQARRQHQTTVVALIIAMLACDSPHRADGRGGLRQRWTDGRIRLRTQIGKNS